LGFIYIYMRVCVSVCHVPIMPTLVD
jgi:hypothetical protein